METVLRLEFYISKNKEYQDKITIEEMLRGCKRYYDRDKTEGINFAEMKDYYDKFATNGSYTDIDSASPNIDPFPSIKSLTTNSKIEDAINWYFHFQALAESTHGKLLAIKMADSNELGEYVRSMTYVLLMCNKALLIIDKHIGGISNEFIVKAIEDADKIVKAPVVIK